MMDPTILEALGIGPAASPQPARTFLAPVEERQFQNFFSFWAKQAGLAPNPDDPLHQYDYRGAFKGGAVPQRDPQDGLYHWPSIWKDQDHPNRFVMQNGRRIDSITGRPADE